MANTLFPKLPFDRTATIRPIWNSDGSRFSGSFVLVANPRGDILVDGDVLGHFESIYDAREWAKEIRWNTRTNLGDCLNQ